MTLFVLVLAALITWQAVEVWHHGAIFAVRRAYVQALPDGGIRGWFRDLLLCPFCLSVWVGTVVAAVLLIDLPVGEEWHHWIVFLAIGLLKLFCYGLAISRLANVANDLSKRARPDTLTMTPFMGYGLPDPMPGTSNIEIEDHDEQSTIPFDSRSGPPGQPTI